MASPYEEISITGYNDNPPDDDGSQTEDNRVKWGTIKDKITDPVKNALEAMNDNAATAFNKIDGGVTSYGSSTQVQESDQGKLVKATVAGITITTPDATDVGAPFLFEFRNGSNGNVTFIGHGTQTVDGIDTSTNPITVPAGYGMTVRTNGSNWETSGMNFPIPVVYPPVGFFKKLSIKVASNTTVTVAADRVTVSNGTKSQTVTLSSTINMGTNGGIDALDTGTIAQATWYAIWVIAKEDGTTKCLASLSGSSPTLPTDYTYAARIGWVRTAAGAAQLMGTWQLGRRAQYKPGLAQTAIIPIIDTGIKGTYSVTSPTLTTANISALVPSTASSIYVFATAFAGGGLAGAVSNILVAPATTWGGTNMGPQGSAGQSYPIHLPTISNGATAAGVQASSWMMLESTSTIAWASSAALGAITCGGWEDDL